MSAPADPIARRRAKVTELSRDGLSLRAIAERVGTSKDTVRRDLEHAERATMRQPDATPETPRATPVAHVAVPVDRELADDLAVLTSTGRDQSEALQHAASILASIYRHAWRAGYYPPDVEPRIVTAQLAPYADRGSRVDKIVV